LLYITATGPIIENEPQNSTVLEGNEVILSCRVIGAPKPNTTWIFGSMNNNLKTLKIFSTSFILFVVLDLFVSLNERIRLLDTGDLFISSTKIQDSGKYTCIRSNEAGSVEMHAYIKVLGTYL